MTVPDDQRTTPECVGVSPSLAPLLELEGMSRHPTLLGREVWRLAALAILIGAISFVLAMLLLKFIGLLTNLCFYGRFSFSFADPTSAYLGLGVIGVPIAGALVVGFMARFGDAGIRGHGIPEAMETILTNESRIPKRITLLKPISAAISIGTGGPFGAEGPIIATGGAFGSLVGQILHTTANERKILLSAGAAAGMAATFGSPVSAVLLAVELLLFEFRARSLIPVALASATAAGLRIIVMGDKPIFAMPNVGPPEHWSLIIYATIGIIAGVAAAGVTRLLYLVEDGFKKYSHVHWMWWPAMGAVVVGLCGYLDNHSMGVGYDNISHLLTGGMALKAILLLLILKWISWTVALGSGTSGGTLAPLFTLGSALGLLLGMAAAHLFPDSGVDVRMAALVGMAGATQAGIIVSDAFSAANGTAINGRMPSPVNLPGAAWVQANGSWENQIQNNLATLGADEGDAISIGTVASNYSVTSYTISDSFNLGTDSMNTYPLRGTWLGFYSSGTNQDGTFTGLIVNPNGNMWVIGNNSNTIGSSVAISGFNAAATHTLSYSVDLATGTISNILLDGNAVSLTAPSGTFTLTDTAYAGFHNMSNNGNSVGTVGNFVLSSPQVPVPEPATLGLMAVGGLGLLLLKRQKMV